jgi:hypothetical protein
VQGVLAVPEEPDDDGLVPPIKVMRRRLNGVYSAEHGFAGTTRRYVLIVAMLVGLPRWSRALIARFS